MPEYKLDMMLDSGAFSAWKLRQEIDVGEYAEFLKEHKGYYKWAINLDSIPGRFGKVPTLSEVDGAAESSWANLEYLESCGIDVLPVFHQGEDFKWLDRMIQKGYDYVCISPDNGKNVKQKREWLDRVYSAITDKDGYPVVKTHGLAVTSLDLVFRYPFMSVDSATWIQFTGFGGVYVPKWVDGQFVYDRSPHTVTVSRKATTSIASGTHFDRFGEETKQHIVEFFESEGYTYEDVAETFEARAVICVRVLKRIEETKHDGRFLAPPADLLAPTVSLRGREGQEIDHVAVYFALSCASIYSDILTVEECNKRLFSYFILKDKPQGFLPFYAQTGCYPMGKSWKRWCSPGNIGSPNDPVVYLPRTDVVTDERRNDPIRKVRKWKRT